LCAVEVQRIGTVVMWWWFWLQRESSCQA